MAKEEVIAAKQRIATAEELVRQLTEAQKPVQASFDESKHKAETQFLAFLKDYPKSKYVPDDMARLGTLQIEFKEYAKAAKVLAELAANYPTAKSAKDGIFNLGRAQFETGKVDEAEQTFKKLLEHPELPATVNLSYISEKMLEARRPGVSLAASRELLARSENPKHPDYQLLCERVREPALFRAGEASYGLGNFKDALGYFGKLLVERPKSAYFFQVKFRMGMARRQMTPPDPEGAIRDFSEILQYSEDMTMSNRAVCELGLTLAMTGQKDDLQKAVARFQQVVRVADPAVPENQPLIEQATYESARVFARLGDVKQRDEMVKLYQQKYPQGKYRQEIGNLPAPTAAAAPAAKP